ncbi:phenazine biosynthesis PhzC/PhzF protein [Calocera viscosa TUFC12733]|uniref:Phenazine biosynthesis PhzC/PhzF protein n=1 Tax=Calocera viscosa (strain TUFC12733) TaxID=1330018 RepID=A0A167GPQ5_CALVF|nr:phenazine biosynthesis PhzC/PhzF protein [Calocera viscosa TUFC12733]
MGLQYYIIDAFTSTPFAGNPACVIVLSSPSALSDERMQIIAREFNLPETAYLVPKDRMSSDDLDVDRYSLRWFTPEMEFPICGHATLASAHVLLRSLGNARAPRTLKFDTMSGELTAKLLVTVDANSSEGEIEIALPAGFIHPPIASVVEKAQQAIIAALGREIDFIYFGAGQGVSYGGYLLVEVAGVTLEELDVDPGPLLSNIYTTVILTTTSPESTYHFVSRVFAPAEGIPEDPVTGSAHCLLAPYWSQRLDIPPGQELRAKQVSARGGEMTVIWDEREGKCRLRGRAVTSMRGELMTLHSS